MEKKENNDFISSGRMKKLIELTVQAIAAKGGKSPVEAEALHSDANKFFRQGNYEKAVEVYTQSLAKAEKSITYSNRALALLKMNK
jgi:tetratricopeptide (TPR) repeat protein